ncbi:MAG: c-type cytochrome [Chitinophagaceae bacterium]
MKRVILACFAVVTFAACGGNSSNENKPGKTEDISANPDYQKGLELVAKNKCLTCHAIDKVVTGPAYREVAKKYADSPDTIVAHLAGKIISGGTGVWGQILMTPHPDLSKEDAEAMVKYILLLK